MKPEGIPIGATGVYAIRNLFDGKIYIGSSARSLISRCSSHRGQLNGRRHPNYRMSVAWSRCGESAFEFTVIEYCPPELCVSREQWWMDRLEPEYNISPTAGSPRGVKWTPEARARAKNRVIVPMGKEARERMSVLMKGRTFTKETLAKMKHTQSTRVRTPLSAEGLTSIINHMRGNKHGVGWVPTDEQRKRMSASRIGRKMSAESIEKTRLAHVGSKRTPESRAKMSNAAKGNKRCVGRIVSLETRQKISAANKVRKWKPPTGWRHSPDTIEKMRRAKIGKKASDETRKKMAESHRARLKK